ncbi:glycerophosphodiester phosphodiesterase [Corynebacterium pacaense]|uniref:glycerophosphodiester phosphodiesterase n=1 Tax=Corynebacterium pacaense TaxID=1816684 RepID=UPI0009B9570F|nr:glycerophosphodiester phosphodiesterase [Corynebacterium pacaense]
MYIVAHRGAEDTALENTLAAFRAAETADAIELDVHSTRDNHLVVLHDRSAERVAAPDSAHRDAPVASLNLDQVRDIRLRDGSTIPTLEEVLAVTDLPIQVEIKAAGAVPAIAELIDRRPGELERLLFISFSESALVEICDRLPGCRVGLLREDNSDLGLIDQIPQANMAAYLPSWRALELSMIEDLHRRGIRVGCWTIRDERALALAERAGADFATVSDPERFRSSSPERVLTW